MSRSIQRSKCTRVGCLTCKPHKVTRERPISERRAPSTGDLPTGHWFVVDPYNDEDWHDNNEPECDGLCHWDKPCECRVELHEAMPPHRPFLWLGAA